MCCAIRWKTKSPPEQVPRSTERPSARPHRRAVWWLGLVRAFRAIDGLTRPHPPSLVGEVSQDLRSNAPDDGRESLKGTGMQTRTPNDPPAKTMSANGFPLQAKEDVTVIADRDTTCIAVHQSARRCNCAHLPTPTTSKLLLHLAASLDRIGPGVLTSWG